MNCGNSGSEKMRQVTGLEQAYLALEDHTTSATIASLALFDAPTPGQSMPDEPFMRARLDERLAQIPPFRKRIVAVPLGLDHSYLAECHRVDVGRHIRTIKLAAPGDERTLAAEISRIMSTDLVTDGPLWEYTIIEGLADGGVAHLLRTHHALADGTTMMRIWDALSDEPRLPRHEAPQQTLPEPLFGRTEMAARTALGAARKGVKLVKFEYDLVKWAAGRRDEVGLLAAPGFAASQIPGKAGRGLTELVNARLRERGAPEFSQYTKTYGPGPVAPINGRTSARRICVFDDVPFADVRELGKLAGTTINNVVVSVVAGGLRRFLEELGETPTEPIVVACPVSLWGDHVTDPWGNHVHMILADLPVHVADPLERLTQVSESLLAARTGLDNTPTHLLNDLSSLLPRDLYGLVVKIWTRMPDHLARPPWNVVVSNVRGPKQPDTINGVRVRGYFPVSFLSIGGGINISLQGYVDRFCVGIVPDKTGDLAPLTQYLRDAFDELRAALEERGGHTD